MFPLPHRGFTLIETLVAITIFTFICFGTSLLFKEVLSGSKQHSLSLDTVDRARLLEFNFVNELRNAAVGNDGSAPIGQADNNQLIFYSTYRALPGTVQRIRYFVATSTLYKGTVTPTGAPLTYNTASETIVPIQYDVANTTTPAFYYHDGNYAGTSTPLAQPVNINLIKFIRMNLILLSQTERNSTTTFTLSAGGSVRALKNNLGN
jgi:prepilin-type N-terminal cleavage/methylation domain-containing protein